jgi:hypothetical protein
MGDDNTNETTEIAPGVPAPQIVSNPSALNAQIISVLIFVGFGVSVVTSSLTFLNGHDLIGWINFLQSAPVVGWIASAIGFATIAYRAIYKKLKDKRTENILVANTAAAVAMTKDQVAAVQNASTPAVAKAIVAAIDAAPLPTRAPETETPAEPISDRGMIP